MIEVVPFALFATLALWIIAQGWHTRTLWRVSSIPIRWGEYWRVLQRRTQLPLPIIIVVSLWIWYGDYWINSVPMVWRAALSRELRRMSEDHHGDV